MKKGGAFCVLSRFLVPRFLRRGYFFCGVRNPKARKVCAEKKNFLELSKPIFSTDPMLLKLNEGLLFATLFPAHI